MHRSGQSTLEYVYILGICIVALIAIGIYVSRGFQGKYRDLGSQIGSQYSPSSTASQLSNHTISDTYAISTSTVTKVYSTGGVSISTESQQSHTEGTAEIHTPLNRDVTGALTTGED